MPKSNIVILPSNAIVGTISFDLANIYTGNDPQFPVLSIPLEISLTAGIDNQTKPPGVRPISLLSFAAEFSSPQFRVVARLHEEVGLSARHPHQASTAHCRLEVPLDIRTTTKIEESRSGDLQCALQIRPLLAIHGTDLNSGGAQIFTVARMDNFVFNIPRSQWVDLLQRLGFQGLEILEVRYGGNVTAFQIPKAVEEIKHAKKYLIENDWDKAVTHCRRTIETILDSRPSALPIQTQFRVKVETFIGDHLKGLNDRQAKLLSDQMRMIWEVSSQVAHANSVPPCKRSDAEFVIRVTEALVEYFSKLLA